MTWDEMMRIILLSLTTDNAENRLDYAPVLWYTVVVVCKFIEVSVVKLEIHGENE